MIPPEVKLFTWLDVEDAISLRLSGEWPEWLISVRTYWDGLFVQVQPGFTEDAKSVLRDLFDPRVDQHPSLFADFLIALESANGIRRTLPVTIEETDEQPPVLRVVPSLARRALLQRETTQPAKPDPLPDSSPPLLVLHSFKGGVGRTVHALALAQAIARGKNTVLLVDADLEAPGITWLLESRLPSPPVSFSDLLALVHGDTDPSARESIALVSSRLQDAFLNGMHVLPAFRSARAFRSLDVRPEHLLQGRDDPFVLTSVLASLGRSLGVSAVVVDLRAGLSELAAGLLLDPRVFRVIVTTLSGQSVTGTELVLDLIAKRAPSSSDTHPIPVVIMNQAPPELHGSDILRTTEERLLAAITSTANKEDLISADVLRGPSWFDAGLLALPASWQDALAAVEKSTMSETVASLAQLIPSRESFAFSSPIAGDLISARQRLAEMAGRLVYAEKGEGDEFFLPTTALRRLVADHRTQLPVAVIVGAKGAGKTYTYLQVVRRGSWNTFAEAAGEGGTAADALLCPVLQPVNANPSVLDLLRMTRQSAAGALALGEPLEPHDLQDLIRGWLTMGLHEGQWRDHWLDLMAWAAGMSPRKNGAGRLLGEELAKRGQRLLMLFDGLEDLFQGITTSDAEQRALRSLLQDVPNWLTQQPERSIGLVVFVRRDMVSAAVRQNSAQLLSRYEPYALRWDPVEALRLVAWIARKSDLLLQEPSVDVRQLDQDTLTNSLIPLWGRKLGADKSREGRSAEWIIAALSDFRGQIQARDLVRFLSLAAKHSTQSALWPDRVLVPSAIRDAVGGCSTEKISEIALESPALSEIFEKLRTLPQEKKSVPFKREDAQLTADELLLLELNGVVVADEGLYYLPEIFRRGLDFSAGARPKVLALARRRQRVSSLV